MRRAKRKLVFDLFQMLHRAHQIIQKLESADMEESEKIFITCQECAIQIGNEIEYWEGEGTHTVKLLENYCEEVYQCMQPADEWNGLFVYERLEQNLAYVENSFEREIPIDKLEAVFLPYNASMWGSLASIWKAADRDEDCNAVVVPIPYFDKHTDGSFGQMHYEGAGLPVDVPIVSWEEYDLKQRYPDIIFIHNPYDDCNFVTSVHPQYYSRYLKNFTDKLVYVPYYLCVNEKVSENTIAVSAVLNSDYVIMQSEECCEKAVRIYDQLLEMNGIAGYLKAGREKFLPLGSPIVDSLQQQVEFDKLPAEWQRIIKAKNSRPKIVMYNTHISDVMGPNADRFFHKIRSVFDVFKKRKDLILLWRPHPLMWQTIQSMNPDAAEEYQKIVDCYQKEGWGIFDDTSDVNRSVSIADAYYGDWSSLAAMFQEAGKPVMIQDLDHVSEREEYVYKYNDSCENRSSGSVYRE